MSTSEQELDLTMPTRDGEHILITTARFTREGVAEVQVRNPAGLEEIRGWGEATIITAKQARALATAFDKLAAYWGE
jgi:hypothetical protein